MNEQNKRYNLYIEDHWNQEKKFLSNFYGESPLLKIADIFRYGEYSNLDYIPVDIRIILPNVSIFSYIKHDKNINDHSIAMKVKEISIYSLNFDRIVKPYNREIFNYST